MVFFVLIVMVVFVVILILMGSWFGIYSFEDVVINLVMFYVYFWYINVFILFLGGVYFFYCGFVEYVIWVVIVIGVVVLILLVGLFEDIWVVNCIFGILFFFVFGLMLVCFEVVIL